MDILNQESVLVTCFQNSNCNEHKKDWAWVSCRVNPCGIFGGLRGTATGFNMSSSIFCCQYFSSIVLHAHVSPGGINERPDSGYSSEKQFTLFRVAQCHWIKIISFPNLHLLDLYKIGLNRQGKVLKTNKNLICSLHYNW